MHHIACGILRAPADPLVRPVRAPLLPSQKGGWEVLTCLSAAAAVSPLLSPRARFFLHSSSSPLHLCSHPLDSATVLPCDTGRAGDPPIMIFVFLILASSLGRTWKCRWRSNIWSDPGLGEFRRVSQSPL